MGTASGTMTATQAYGSVAETCGLKSKDVKAIVEGIVNVAAEQLKKNGSFKFWGLEPQTQEEASPPCSQRCESFHQGAMRVQGKASKQDGPCFPMKKLKEMIN